MFKTAGEWFQCQVLNSNIIYMYIFMSSKEYNTPQKTASIFLQYAKHKLGSVSNWNLEMLVFEERGKSE